MPSRLPATGWATRWCWLWTWPLASSTPDGRYTLAGEDRTLDAAGMVKLYQELVARYPIVSIQDGMAESNWDG